MCCITRQLQSGAVFIKRRRGSSELINSLSHHTTVKLIPQEDCRNSSDTSQNQTETKSLSRFLIDIDSLLCIQHWNLRHCVILHGSILKCESFHVTAWITKCVLKCSSSDLHAYLVCFWKILISGAASRPVCGYSDVIIAHVFIHVIPLPACVGLRVFDYGVGNRQNMRKPP